MTPTPWIDQGQNSRIPDQAIGRVMRLASMAQPIGDATGDAVSWPPKVNQLLTINLDQNASLLPLVAVG